MASTQPSTVPITKICGTQDPESAAVAAAAGADLIGMIFVPKSKRCMSVDRASEVVRTVSKFRGVDTPVKLDAPTNMENATAAQWYTACAQQLRATLATTKPLVVGVFMDQPSDEVNALAESSGIDIVQLHGSEDNSYIKRIKKPVLKVVHVTPELKPDDILKMPLLGCAGNGYAILLDTKVGSASGGTGKSFDWSVATAVQAAGVPVIVAGGLKPDTVATAVTTVLPLGVDVSSGVESEASGTAKDPVMVQAFISNAKSSM